MSAINSWCPPNHTDPEGPTDPLNTTLRVPFVVAIYGASKGIGASAAICYAKAGASGIAILARNVDNLEQRKAELEKINSKAKIVPLQCDVTDWDQVARSAKEIESEFGRLDVLIINAGTVPKLVMQSNGLRDWPSNFIDASLQDFKSTMELNTMTPWTICHYLLPLLEKTTDGAQSIVLITSVAAAYMDPKMMSATYSLSKFAATRIMEHVHEAHKDNGICAYALQPGGVKSDLSEQAPEGKGWEKFLTTSPEMAGGFSVWLTSERRPWLSGRYVDARWDVEELLKRKEEIVAKDLLKFRMVL